MQSFIHSANLIINASFNVLYKAEFIYEDLCDVDLFIYVLFIPPTCSYLLNLTYISLRFVVPNNHHPSPCNTLRFATASKVLNAVSFWCCPVLQFYPWDMSWQLTFLATTTSAASCSLDQVPITPSSSGQSLKSSTERDCSNSGLKVRDTSPAWCMSLQVIVSLYCSRKT